MGRFLSKTIARLSFLKASFSFKPRSARARWFFVLTAIFGLFLVIHPANAQGSILSGVADGFLWVFSEIMLALARLCIALSVFALKFFIEVAQYNGYVNTPTVVLGWTMVRDVANMFFVVILLVIAFATILGVEQYEWKKTLVKLVFAAVFINFSKLIAGIIIDFAHVFTITFLNAVSATAGGNLINMFHLNDIYRISGREFAEGDRINIEIFIGAVIALVFSLITLVSIGSYLIVMIARIVVLWVLIILSPVAFIFQVLPNTQQWAKEWWDRFSKQVLVAPVMVFFLWLAFATLGTGDFVRNDLNINLDVTEAVAAAGQTPNSGGATTPQKVSLSDVSSWENMANFFIAVAFLFVGLGVVRKLGVVGGGIVSGAFGFGKKVVTIASGFAAGRWLVGRGAEVGKGAGRSLTEPFKTAIETEKAALKAQIYSTGRRPKEQLSAIERPIGALVRGYVQRQKRLKKTLGAAEMEERLAYTRKEAKPPGRLFYEGRYGFREQTQEGAEIVGVDKDTSELITDEHIGKDASGKYVTEADVALGAKVAVTMDQLREENKIGELPRDRFLEGVLQAEEQRKKAKDAEFQALGRYETLKSGRVKDGKFKSGTVMKEVQQREARAKGFESEIEELTLRVKAEVGPQMSQAFAKMATAEVAKNTREKEADRRRAETLAKAYRDAGENVRAQAILTAVEDKWVKRNNELYETLGYSGRMALESNISNDALDLRDTIQKKEARGEDTASEQKRLQELIKQKVALATVNSSADRESSHDARMNSYEAIGLFDQEGEAGVLNDKNRLRFELSRMLSRVVEDSDDAVIEAIAELEHAYKGNDREYQSSMASLLNGYKSAAMNGDDNSIGIIDEYITKEGRLDHTWGRGIRPKVNEQGRPIRGEDGKYILQPVLDKKTGDEVEPEEPYKEADLAEGLRQYFASRVNLSKLDEASSYANIGKNNEGKVGIVGFGGRGRKNLLDILGGKDARSLNQSVATSFWSSLNDIKYDQLDDDQKRDIRETIKAITGSLANKQAKKDLVDKHIQPLIEKFEANFQQELQGLAAQD